MQVVLPDCSALAAPVGLSTRQRRELVRLLAEEGPDALEAWLRQEERLDPTIRERLEQERTRLEREARAEQAQLEGRHADEERTAESAWEKKAREAAQAEAEVRARLEEVRGGPTLTREDLVRGSELYRAVLAQDGRRSWGRRALDALRRAWLWLVALWVRLVRAVTGRQAKAPRTVITLPQGAVADLGPLGPDAVLALRESGPRTWKQRWREAKDRLTGRQSAAEALQERLEQERRRVEAQRRQERAEEEQRLQERLRAARAQEKTVERTSSQDREARRARHRREQEQLRQRFEDGPYAALRRDLVGELETMGLLDASGRVTLRLLQRFSTLLYEQARRSIPAAGQPQPGTYIEGEGEYELGPLRSSHEEGAMDLMSSVLHARLHHPHVKHLYDQDLRVHREVRSATAHVVLVFDTSGSMEEQGRLDAAKRVCLVLDRAVKDQNPDHRVDLLAMHTSVERMDLAACWNAEPQGFTNHGAALREARRLFEDQGADHKVFYLVTDGLPEAWTRDGVDVADRPDVCMPYALRQARALRGLPDLRTVVIQLETRDEAFLEAAARIAAAAGGEVEGLDPERLMGWMLGHVDQAVKA